MKIDSGDGSRMSIQVTVTLVCEDGTERRHGRDGRTNENLVCPVCIRSIGPLPFVRPPQIKKCLSHALLRLPDLTDVMMFLKIDVDRGSGISPCQLEPQAALLAQPLVQEEVI